MINRFLLISTVVLSVVLLIILIDPRIQKVAEVKAERDYSSQYKFTNPILDFENVKMESSSLIYEEIKSKINKLKDKYDLEFASVYFRDLDNGQWIGINEKEEFASASLIKLPILISFLRESEAEPQLPMRKVTISAEDVTSAGIQDILPETQMKEGETYTLMEVAERMIEQSDNVAMKVMVRNLESKYRDGIFEAIGVKYVIDRDDVLVRVKDYASFFRILFNASYLSRENSELALEVLSKSTFKNGLTAGVPKSLTVAHKFGERSYYVDGIVSSRQLHDCGIIYYPQKPYILCVMTRGQDYVTQTLFIKEVSKLFYTELEKKI